MFRQLRTAATLLVILTVLTGVIYPGIVTVIAQVAFPRQASGSLIRQGSAILGSELIGQPFSKPENFWGRLSATQPVPYNAAASQGSNFGPLHPELRRSAEARMAALRADVTANVAIPADLVTSSASGLDPHISPAAAQYQVQRIAAARKMSEDAVRRLIRRYTENRQFGVLGEPRVNVLRLNLALDQQ